MEYEWRNSGVALLSAEQETAGEQPHGVRHLIYPLYDYCSGNLELPGMFSPFHPSPLPPPVAAEWPDAELMQLRGTDVGYAGAGEGVVVGSAPTVRCQAEGCSANLVMAKQYHRRHKVCELHSKATAVVAHGLTQRFCQQCSRFHVLSEFDQWKRSCRRRLAEHNRRRRKTHPPPSSPPAPPPRHNPNAASVDTPCPPDKNAKEGADREATRAEVVAWGNCMGQEEGVGGDSSCSSSSPSTFSVLPHIPDFRNFQRRLPL